MKLKVRYKAPWWQTFINSYSVDLFSCVAPSRSIIKEKRIVYTTTLFASDHSFFQLNGSFCTILQNSLLYAVWGRNVELTHEQNNLQQTARNNKTCREYVPIKPNLIDAHSMVHYTCDTNFLRYCEWLLHWTPYDEQKVLIKKPSLIYCPLLRSENFRNRQQLTCQNTIHL